MYKVILLRHGESTWNKENLFTGWTDVDLSEKGVSEAKEAGRLLKEEGYTFDYAFTSTLKRAIRTLWLTMDEMDLMWVPTIRAWQINERHYGALQGKNKSQVKEEFGDEQFMKWRRSYDIRPPALEKSDERWPGHEAMYATLPESTLPLTECLKDVVSRTIPYWEGEIAPKIKEGKQVIIAAHGNSLRALVKYLDGVSDDEITHLNIPTGVPLIYELDDELNAVNHYYLGDQEALKAKIEVIKNQANQKKE